MLHDKLWESNRDLVETCLLHPFVRGLDDGTLPQEVFRRYVAQDAFFLEAFARAYALALAHSCDSEAIELFHALIGGVCEELTLHRSFAAALRIDLRYVEPTPACHRCTDFLLATAWHGSSGEILAAMTPCMRLYAFLALELAKSQTKAAVNEGTEIKNRPYGRWIATYSAPEFQRLADRLEEQLDRRRGESWEYTRCIAMRCNAS